MPWFSQKNGAATKRKVSPRSKKEQKILQQQQQPQQQQSEQQTLQPTAQQPLQPTAQQPLQPIVTVEQQQQHPQSVTTIAPNERMYEVHFERNDGQGYLEKRIEQVVMQGQQVQQGQPVQQQTEGHLVTHNEDRSVLAMVSVENGEIALLRQQNQNEAATFQPAQLTPITHAAHVAQAGHIVPMAVPSSGNKWNPQSFPLTHPISITSQSAPQLHLTGQPVTVPQPVIEVPVTIPVSQSETTLLMCPSGETITATQRNVNY